MGVILIILLVLSVLAGIGSATQWCETWFGGIFCTIFMTIVYWALSSVAVLIVVGWISDSFADKKETPVKTYIYGIDKMNVPDGTFFLGSGTVDNEYRYSYYVKVGTKQAFKLDDVKASKTVIIEDEENQPYILKWKTVEIVNKEAWKNWVLEMKKNVEVDYIEIHVPKGTIVQDMKGRL